MSKKEAKKEIDFQAVKNADDNTFQNLTRKQKNIYRREQKYKTLYGVSYIDLYKDENKKNVRHNNGLIAKYWTNKKGLFALIIFIYLLLTGISILPAILFSNYINYMTESLWDSAIIAVAMYAGLVLFQNIIAYLNNLVMSRLMVKAIYEMRVDMTNKITQTQFNIFKTLGSGKILSRLSSDTGTYVSCVEDNTKNISALVSNVIFTIYLIILSPILAGIFVGIALLKLVANIIYNNTIMKTQIKVNMALADIRGSVYNEMAKGILDSKFLNIEQNLGNQVNGWNFFQRNNFLHKRNHYLTFNFITEIFFTLGFCLFLFLAVKQLSIGAVSLGTVVVIFSYRNNVMDLFKKIIDISKTNMNKRIASNRICDILSDSKSPKEIFGDKELKNFKGEIKFENVSFTYEGECEILKILI